MGTAAETAGGAGAVDARASTAAAALDGPAEAAVFWWDHLDAAQLAALDRMRLDLAAHLGGGDHPHHAAAVRALPPSLRTDLSLLRFLRARSFDPERALAMYLAMAEWRLRERPGLGSDGGGEQKNSNGDNDGDDGGESAARRAALRRHFPSSLHGTDRFGRPVSYRFLGRSDADALLRAMTVGDFLRLHLEQNERFRERVLPACSRAAGRPILSGTVVLDMEGFSLTRHFSPAVRAVVPLLSAIDQTNFPEHLGSMVIVNAPALFRSAWLTVRPFLDERTLRKISVVGGGEAAREALLALIPRERLPEAYGGTSRAGVEWADVGPWVDEEEEKQEQELRKGDGGTKLNGDNDDGDDDDDVSGGDREEEEAAEALRLPPPPLDGGAPQQQQQQLLRRRRLLVQLVADAAAAAGRRTLPGASGGGLGSSSSSSGGGGGAVARLLLRRRSSSDPPHPHLTVAIARRRSTPTEPTAPPSAFCTPAGSRRASFDDDYDDRGADEDEGGGGAPRGLLRASSWTSAALVLAVVWHARVRRASAAADAGLERQGSLGSALAGKLAGARARARRRPQHEHAD